MTIEEETARGCATPMVDDYIPKCGCPHTHLSDRGAELISHVPLFTRHWELSRSLLAPIIPNI